MGQTGRSNAGLGQRLRRGALAVLFVGITVTGALVGATGAIALPTFTDTLLPDSAANPLSAPTAIVPLLDTGRALVLEKAGAVRVLGADGTLLDADALDLNVCTASEMGLMGGAVDPGFATNGFIYLFYTHNAGNCASTTGRFNRVSRFEMTADTIDPASELVLLDNLNIPAGNHNGGDLHIGKDGYLYVTVGDGGGINPRGATGPAAQDLSVFNGKILRITTTGGVPSDNPFVGATGAQSCALLGISAPATAVCTEIYDYGLRNPFRFAFDPNASGTRFFINDVGENTWEEVDQGGSGLNYGWNIREGFCANGSTTDCAPTPAGYTDPLTTYNHSIGCTYITAGAFVPNGLWPGYDGDYLFGDGGCGKVFLMTSGGSVDYNSPFATTTGLIVDMAFVTQGGQTAL
jgi:glucose/arabinose dehydrogenase